MPAKKTRQADKAVYLLSANHKVRRVSLKKISDRVKKARRPRRVRAVEKVTAAESSLPVHREVAPAKVAFISVLAASLFLLASLVGASWSSSSAGDAQAADAGANAPVLLAADVASVPVIRATPSVEPRVVKASAPAPAPVPAPPKAAPVAAVAPATSAPSSAPALVAADAQPVATTASTDTVTVSGCLDFDGKSAWLKDTTGIEAPRARSWRSGFLKKGTPRIALVGGPINAEANDGHRVSVTGVIVDREMHVSSLKPIANNCD